MFLHDAKATPRVPSAIVHPNRLASRVQVLPGIEAEGRPFSGTSTIYGDEHNFVRRIPAFFHLIPYTPVPSNAIAANGLRRLRPIVYELITSLIEG